MTNLQEVGAAFKHYRGKRKHVHYPKDLWDRAVMLSETYPKTLIAETLSISFSSLKRHIKLRENSSLTEDAPFLEIQSTSSLRVCISLKSSMISSIDLTGGTKEITQIILALHNGDVS